MSYYPCQDLSSFRKDAGYLPCDDIQELSLMKTYQRRGAVHIWPFRSEDQWSDLGSNPIPDLTPEGGAIARVASDIPGCLGAIDSNDALNARAQFNLAGITDMGFDADRCYTWVFEHFETGAIPGNDRYFIGDDQQFGTAAGNMISVLFNSTNQYPCDVARASMTPGTTGIAMTDFDDNNMSTPIYVTLSYNVSTTTITAWWRVGSAGAKQTGSKSMVAGVSSAGEQLSLFGFQTSQHSADARIHFMAVLDRQITESEIDEDLAIIFP